MKLQSRLAVALICLNSVLSGEDDCSGCAVGETFLIEDQVLCEPFCEDEVCEEEYWCREICYEPMYYTVQKAIERQTPVKKLCCRIVPKEYTVQRVRYVPEYYTEKISKNEFEYFYQDDWKVSTQMVSERQCEWVPRFVWKKVTKDSCCDDTNLSQ